MDVEMNEIKVYGCIQWITAEPGIGPAKAKKIIEEWMNQEPDLADMFFGSQNFDIDIIKEEMIRKTRCIKPSECDALIRNKSQAYEQALTRVHMWKQKDARFNVITSYSEKYPEYLKEIHDYPLVLYCSGDLDLIKNNAVAIVGTRTPSQYGKSTAEWFGKSIALTGLTVVSGFADGIDSHVHYGALEGGRTIAVLGAGYQSSYIRRNRRLYQMILENGLMVSEYAPEVQPRTSYFPMRNRIISGMSLGTILIEAGERSGALITARYALEQNRELYVVPSDAMLMKNKGGHRYIGEGAMLVDDPTQVIFDLNRVTHLSASFHYFDREDQENQKNKYSESENKKKIMILLQNRGALSYSELAQMTGLSIERLRLEIVEMTMDEQVVTQGDHCITLKN